MTGGEKKEEKRGASGTQLPLSWVCSLKRPSKFRAGHRKKIKGGEGKREENQIQPCTLVPQTAHTRLVIGKQLFSNGARQPKEKEGKKRKREKREEIRRDPFYADLLGCHLCWPSRKGDKPSDLPVQPEGGGRERKKRVRLASDSASRADG